MVSAMTPPDRLAQIQERLAQATLGPWEWKDKQGLWDSQRKCWVSWNTISGNHFMPTEVSNFISHAPTDLASLLARLDAAEGVVQAAQFLVEDSMGLGSLRKLRTVLTRWRAGQG